jgi:1-acyl-sn-glycerol-3-phosphate acyltransferase
MKPAATAADSLPLRPRHLLWGLCADVAIFFYTVLLGGLATVLTLVTRRGWPVDVLGPIWCRWILRVCGIHVEISGLEHLDPAKSYVIISNHLSNFDIWATLGRLPLKVRFIAKKELLRVPVFGWALAVSEHIVIDRANPDEAIARINARIAANVDAGFCILFYAEGTRSPDGKVHPFKKGGVSLAIRTGMPIVPMSISGTRKFLPKSSLIIRPGGRVKIVLDKPIETRGIPFEQRDELNQLVRDAVMRNYTEDY